MATFTASSAVDMRLLSAQGLFDYLDSTFSSTLIHVFDDATHFVDFSGTGFAANPLTGAITGGTLTGINYVEGTPVMQITGASMPAVDFYNFAVANQSQAALSALFSGNDVFSGSSGNDALLSFAGNDTLSGGAGLDTLVGGAGNDVYMFTAGDTLTEAVGEGSDTVRSASAFTLKANFENLTLEGGANIAGTGNTVANKLIGNTGNNLLKGLGGRDVLTGNGGNDTLDGGAGNDILIGSGGADTFSFSTALTNNVDTVRDFAVGVDKLRLDDDIFTALTGGAPLSGAFVSGIDIKSAQDSDDRIAYDTSTGKLYYDADGFGGNDAVQFAVLGSTTHPALTSTDFVIVT